MSLNDLVVDLNLNITIAPEPGVFILNITATDFFGTPIQVFSATVDGATRTTINGVVTFANIIAGNYGVQVEASGFVSHSQSIFMDSDKDLSFTLFRPTTENVVRLVLIEPNKLSTVISIDGRIISQGVERVFISRAGEVTPNPVEVFYKRDENDRLSCDIVIDGERSNIGMVKLQATDGTLDVGEVLIGPADGLTTNVEIDGGMTWLNIPEVVIIDKDNYNQFSGNIKISGEMRWFHQLTFNTVGSGSVAVSGNTRLQHKYVEGNTFTLTATANVLNKFVRWSGFVDSTTNSITVTMPNHPIEITAHFEFDSDV
jgi:hypothetical protein